ncbi:MAG: LLM class flavin-dependent oxidoreductase [Acidobacteria bacterium]|nr:LLM class flavin-dependent oxidoreductase [Acidobacteriota bacterium]
MVPLSVLDLSPVTSSATPRQAIVESIALARRCDGLSYTRYWVAEHHGMANIATSAPEVLIAHIAASTTRMRVGAGGIMLPNHNPLRVVEIFRTLEALHPGRIDLGLGRAPGTDPVTAAALRRGQPDDPNERLAELLAFANGTFPEGHPFAGVIPMPSDVRLPPIWMLGSTLAGASIAASLGLRYAFAGHFAMQNAQQAVRHYRERFQPSADLNRPHAMVALAVICGEDDEQAERLAAPATLAVVRNRTGRRAPIASVEEALAYRFTPEERAIADDFRRGAVVGGPATVLTGLTRIADELGADELMLTTIVPDHADRVRSYELVSHAAQITPVSVS